LDKTLVSLFLEDLSSQEIADVMGISDINVRVKLHRIKKNLKQLWEQTDDGCE
jgi:RNA polymerase sigma-70 factor (ECF subfamily)